MNKLIKKSLINFCSLNILQKIILVIISSIFLLLFVQNFIFSSSFDILMLRSVDDFAFQNVLRKNHENIIQFRFGKLFELYAYGYGWLFWIIHTTITFPFYLISLLGSDFLLISTARNISLLFMVGSCFLLFKSIKKYTNDKYIPYFAVLLFVSYPYFAYSSMSFRTIAQGSFFCILTFYLIIRNNLLSKKDLKYIAISFAACLGTKLSTAVFAPLIALFLIDRFGFKLNKENFKKAFYFLKYFIPSSIFFINPSLFIAPFKWSLFTKYGDVMSYYFKNVQTDHGSGGIFLTNFQDAFSTDFLYKYVLAILTLVFLVRFIYDLRSNKQNKFDFFYIFIFLVFSSLYLANHIKMGAAYITNYFFSFSFLLLLPLVTLEKVGKYIRITLLMTLVALNIALNYSAIKHSYLHYHNKYNSQTTQTLLESQKELQKLVGNSDQKLNLLIDYRAPVIYSNFRKNISTISMFDNVSVVEKWSKSEFDYILLHKDSKMLLDKKDFQRISTSADEALKNTWVESRGMVESLINTGIFRKSRYEVIYDKNKLIFFKRL
jgi:hypothetical protein